MFFRNELGEFPYICCRVHYEIDGFTNDFCMPIANNAGAIGDVVSSFDNADELDIACNSYLIKLWKNLMLLLVIFLL